MSGGRWFVLGAALALAGCNPDEGGRSFGGGGSSWTPDDSSDDTGSSSDDTGSSVDPDAPVITEASAEFSDFPGYGIVIIIEAAYTDANDDLQGGIVSLGIQEVSSGETSEAEIPIDGTQAFIDEGVLTAAVNGFDENEAHVVTLVLYDAEGLGSAAEVLDVEAYAGK